MLFVRRVGALLLAVMTGVVWFTMAPEDAEYTTFIEMPSSYSEEGNEVASLLYDLSVIDQHTRFNTQNVFEQVVASNEEGERTSALVALGVLGIALFAAAGERTSRSTQPAFPQHPPAAGPPQWNHPEPDR